MSYKNLIFSTLQLLDKRVGLKMREQHQYYFMSIEVCMESTLARMCNKTVSNGPQIIEKDIPFVLDAYFIIRNLIDYKKLGN